MMSNLIVTLVGLACGGLLILAFAGGGIYLIYSSVQNRKKAGVSVNWPSVPGTIQVSEISQGTGRDSDGDSYATYQPSIRYTYSVAGIDYTSNQIAFGPAQSDRNPGQAQSVVNRFPVGSPATVYYNPQNPSEAVLERNAKSSTATMVIGIVLLVIVACIACPLGVWLLLNPAIIRQG